MSRPIPHELARTHFDAIIIGAGINGAGIARDAALRGLRVLLLDKGDLSGGTSSWSSRLIHGGLRYLEHFEFGLVKESLRERELLLRLAPHLVKPLPMLLPIYERGRRGPLTIRAGMMLYDLLSQGKSLARHKMLKPADTLRRARGLNPQGLRGAALYYDAQAEFAERLVIENALAARAHGATILTYARAESLIVENDAVCGVRLIDLLSSESFAVRSSMTLNVAGPWVDEILTGARASTDKLIGGTKGSHLIVEKFEGAPAEDALYVEARADGRPFFILPWNGKFLIGTTDLRYDGDLDRVEASEEEIDYLLEETNRVLPEANLKRESVLYSYAGVRPLPYVHEGAASRITRRHFIHDHGPALKNFRSIVGGKLTTYRNLSEQAVDMIFQKLGREVQPCMTAASPLPGAETSDFAAFCEEFKRSNSEFSQSLLERLLGIYGTRAQEVLRIAEEGAALKKVFDAETGAIAAEIVLAFRHEMAESLTDCLLRRTMVGLNSTAGLEALEGAAQIARQFLGWTESRTAHETAAYREYIRRFHPARVG